MDDDGELLRRYIQDGAETAFDELVRRHVGFVYAAALRMTKGTHRAQDVTQAVFTDLCRKARSLCHRPSVVGWLYLSTRYAATQLVRQEARREQRELAAVELQTVNSPASPPEDWARVAPWTDAVMTELGERDHEH